MDLIAHFKSHAVHFKQYSNEKVTKKNLHFTFSIEDLQFINKDQDETMMKFLHRLKEPAKYNVKNGFNERRERKYTNRPINLEKQLVAEAYHNIDPLGNDTMPHIHLLSIDAVRWGKSFSLLKLHISKICEEFDLIPNFDELTEHNPLGVKRLAKGVKSMTWSWQQNTKNEFEKQIKNGIENGIKKLTDYTAKTNSLSYYVKSMETLKRRLNQSKIDLKYKGINLRYGYPIPLSNDDKSVIKLIQDKNFTQKAMKPYLKNPILRDFVRYSAGTTKPYIVEALKQYTDVFGGVRKNQQAVQSYVRLNQKNSANVIRKSQITSEQNKDLSIKNNIRVDIISAAEMSSNTEELHQHMQKAYGKFALRKSKGSVVGCFYTEDEQKQTIMFNDIGLRWPNIKHTMLLNSKKIEIGLDIPKKPFIKPSLNYSTQPKQSTKKKDDTERVATEETITSKSKVIKIEEDAKKAKKRSFIRRIFEKAINKVKRNIQKIKIRFERQDEKEQELVAKLKTAEDREQELTAVFKSAKDRERKLVTEIRAEKDKEHELTTNISNSTNKITEFNNHGYVEERIFREIEGFKIKIRNTKTKIHNTETEIRELEAEQTLVEKTLEKNASAREENKSQGPKTQKIRPNR